MKRTFVINPDMIWISFLGIAALTATVLLSEQSLLMIVLIPAALIVASLILTNGELCLATAILFLPFFTSALFYIYLLPMPGASLNHILLLMLLIGFLLNKKLNLSDVKLAAFFYLGSLLLLIIAVFRADHVASYSIYRWGEVYQPFRFFLRHGFIPLLTSVTFLMIIGCIRSKAEILRTTYYMALSMNLFALIIIGIYFLDVPFGSDFRTARYIIGEHLGLHGNNMADFIIAGFPLMLSMALRPNGRYQKWFYAATALTIAAATLIYSRSAYATILLSFPAIMFLTRRFRLVIPLLVFLVLVVVMMPGVIERAVTGLDQGDVYEITAGRTDTIWNPIWKEWRERFTTAPLKVVFGSGRYGVLDLEVFKNQQMYSTSHAHNMYLDTLMDVGIIGLLFYLVMITCVLVQLMQALYRQIKQRRDEDFHIAAGLLVGIVSFLIRGMTDSFLLPHRVNCYFYIVMAISFVVIRQEQFLRETEGGI